MSIFGFSFWRLVAKKPDLALALLREEPDCIVDGERRDGFVGPFFFVAMDGRHRIYMRESTMSATQDRLTAALR
jgi:hypothetical protein